MIPAVLYARYSSFGQREESIEGQVAACEKYAKENGYCIVHQYIDRAASARNDRRAQFQQMISDSEDGRFQAVLVYQYDRFSRDRFDSVFYKNSLMKNGVKVISVMEPISDDPSGAFMEALLEAQAQFASADLSRKVRRGQQTNVEKLMYNGGSLTFGYRIDENKHYQIDEETAPIIRRIFEQFLEARAIVDIMSELNAMGIRRPNGAEFTKNSIRYILENKKYIGTYVFGDQEIPDGIPAIVDKETFARVQKKLSGSRYRRGVTGDYLLTSKLFCGYCKNGLIGISGKSHTGATHHYYTCSGVKKVGCKKKSVRRDYIEEKVLAECRGVLDDETISAIAKTVSNMYEKGRDSSYAKKLHKELKKTEDAIENLLRALELGQEASLIVARIAEKKEEKESIEAKLAEEEFAQNFPSETEINFFLTRLRDGSINDQRYRKTLVNLLVNKIFLYDDSMKVYANVGGAQVEINVDSIEEPSNSEGSYTDMSPLPTRFRSHRPLPISCIFLPRCGEKRKNLPLGEHRKTVRDSCDTMTLRTIVEPTEKAP